MSDDCVFCQIIQKKSPASFIYEDHWVVAFLSNRPVNEGHTLVIPKNHYENIYEMPDSELAYLSKVVKQIAHAVRATMVAEGIRVVQNNGSASGQVVFHFHAHVIPLKPHEGFTHGTAYREQTHGRLPEALDIDAEKIRRHLRETQQLLIKI